MCASLSKLEALYNNGWHLNDIQHYYYFLDVLWPLLRRFVSSCGFNYGFLYPTWGSDPIQNMCLITIGFSIFFTRLFKTEKPISHAVKWNFSTIIYFPANYLNQFQIIVFLVVNLEKKNYSFKCEWAWILRKSARTYQYCLVSVLFFFLYFYRRIYAIIA